MLAPFDAARAARLRSEAERALSWARAHHATDAFVLYALSELWRLTSNEAYKRDFEAAWRRIGPYGVFSNFAESHNYMGDYAGTGRVMPDYVLGYLTGPGVAPDFLDLARTWMTRGADDVARGTIESPLGHRSPRAPNHPLGWGQGTVMGRYLDPIISRIALGDLPSADMQRYFDAMSLAADYVLGANPLGMVFITGLGARSPREPLHLDSLAAIHEGHGPMPGIPVYGPVDEPPGADYYRPGLDAFYPPFAAHPPMLRYADIRTFVVTSECTIWECQAPHAEHFAALLGPRLSPPAAWLPRPH